MHGTMHTGDGLSTGRKEKLGESAPDSDSGVPTELMVPGSGLDSESNLWDKLLFRIFPSVCDTLSVSFHLSLMLKRKYLDSSVI